jgi:hypothetical protein
LKREKVVVRRGWERAIVEGLFGADWIAN